VHVNPASCIPALVVAAIAAAVGTLGLAGPANADQGGPYVAIAYSPDNGAYGWANNAFTQDQAQDTALQNCRNFGGQQCEIDAWAHNECAALAVMTPQVTANNQWGAHYGWYGATIQEAQDAALHKNGGGEVIVAHCASGDAGWG
jgi:Domain of unknown function (DUF4189)